MNVLILCTGNSARSILAEAIFNRLGNGEINAFSAGSKPTGIPNPFAISLLSSKGYDVSGYRSKSWDEFATDTAPKMDLVITVCDNAANETCPIWPSQGGTPPVRLHWPFIDPAAADGSDEAIAAVFHTVYEQIHDKVAKYLSKTIP